MRAAQILQIPIYSTTQSRAKLGETCHELLPYLNAPETKLIERVDKTAFSMWVPDVARHFNNEGQQQQQQARQEIGIVGIEAHICVTQTTLDALRAGHKVYVLADGVGSVNRQEVRWALERLRAEGAVVTTSESWLFEIMGDADIKEFRAVAGLVKEWKERTKEGLEVLSRI